MNAMNSTCIMSTRAMGLRKGHFQPTDGARAKTCASGQGQDAQCRKQSCQASASSYLENLKPKLARSDFRKLPGISRPGRPSL